jgi:hypothetical protein
LKVVSERVSILKKDNLLSIVILATNSRRKLGVMFLWLIAWTVCGLVVFVNYFKLQEQNVKMFIIVYLSFWAYFEYKIVRAFVWKKFGREKIWVQDGILNYQREINKKGKIYKYNLDLVQNLKIIELSNASWADTINQSFWVKAGERLEFSAQAKIVRFGLQLNETEAHTVFKELNNLIL